MAYSALRGMVCLSVPSTLPLPDSALDTLATLLFLEHAKYAPYSELYAYCFLFLNVLSDNLKVGTICLLKPLLKFISQNTSKEGTLLLCPLSSIVAFLSLCL